MKNSDSKDTDSLDFSPDIDYLQLPSSKKKASSGDNWKDGDWDKIGQDSQDFLKNSGADIHKDVDNVIILPKQKQ
jgi:hypothetical protein